MFVHVFYVFSSVLILWKWAFVHTFNTIWHHMVLPRCKNTYTWVSLWFDITRRHHGEQLGEGEVWIWEVTCPCSSFRKKELREHKCENNWGGKQLGDKECKTLSKIVHCFRVYSLLWISLSIVYRKLISRGWLRGEWVWTVQMEWWAHGSEGIGNKSL